MAKDEKLPLPDLAQMIPQLMSFSLSDIRMCAGQIITIPKPIPASACEELALVSSNTAVVRCEGDELIAAAHGTAEITCSCVGLETAVFRITVLDRKETLLYLPSAVSSIEAEAFRGNSSTGIVLPETVSTIGDHAFEDCPSVSFINIPAMNTKIGEDTFSDAVIICRRNSGAYEYAAKKGLQYIAFSEFPAE